MSVEIAWKQNNLVTDFHLLKLLQVVFGFGLQTFICDFSRQNICSVPWTQMTTKLIICPLHCKIPNTTSEMPWSHNPLDPSQSILYKFETPQLK